MLLQRILKLCSIVTFTLTTVATIGCNQNRAHTLKASTSWRHVHTGSLLYTGADDPLTNTEPICNSIAEFKAWYNELPNHCFHVSYGLPVVVVNIEPPECGDRID